MKYLEEMRKTAQKLVAPGKGILAVDEPAGILGSFFTQSAVVEDTIENRRRHNEMLFTCDPELSESISGVILLPTALDQESSDGVSFIKLLDNLDIVPGVKVDEGIIPLEGSEEEEPVTKGLDNLPEMCVEYKNKGARFAKWRCAFKIGACTPSPRAILANTQVLARYARICQQHGLMPLVEPDIVCDGDHDLARAQAVSEQVLTEQFKALKEHGVVLEAMLLKCSMVIPGVRCTRQYTPEDIATATVTALARSVPAAMPGVTFLSGGQSEVKATTHLNAINNHPGSKPWKLSFSFGRALQASVLKVWAGQDENNGRAQKVLLRRARANGRATLGLYTPEDEDRDEEKKDADSNKSLHIENYKY